MKRNVYVVLLTCFSLLLVGCAKPKKTKLPTYEEARQQALKEAPYTLKPIELRSSLKCDEKPTPVHQQDILNLPYSGLLFTEKRAECLRAQIAERDRLRAELEAERLRARTKEIINDAAYKRLAEETKSSWWDKNGGNILFASGAAVGMAIVLGVMYAITGGKSLNTSTTTSNLEITRP